MRSSTLISQTGEHRPAASSSSPSLANVSSPRDPHEQEAERVADSVMRMPDPQVQRSCACGGSCEDCKAGGSSSGHPLDPDTRHFMESRFSFDFGRVRVHRDAAAQESAHELNARAFTTGHDIAFAAGQYAPQTSAGRRLLAHELVHVVQQSGGEAAGTIQRDADAGTEPPQSQDAASESDPTREPAPPAVNPDAGAVEMQAPGGTGGGGPAPAITLETGNSTWNPVNNAVHQNICVEGYGSGGPKRCFSFAATGGAQLPQFSSTWLGWSSIVAGAILTGEIYTPAPVPGSSIVSTHSPTAAQASNWLNYMNRTRVGLQDGYSVARHNCRTFSQWEFRDAPSHW